MTASPLSRSKSPSGVSPGGFSPDGPRSPARIDHKHWSYRLPSRSKVSRSTPSRTAPIFRNAALARALSTRERASSRCTPTVSNANCFSSAAAPVKRPRPQVRRPERHAPLGRLEPTFERPDLHDAHGHVRPPGQHREERAPALPLAIERRLDHFFERRDRRRCRRDVAHHVLGSQEHEQRRRVRQPDLPQDDRLTGQRRQFPVPVTRGSRGLG